PCGDRTTEGAVLTVTSPPTISSHPGPASINPPAMAPVSVTADGPVSLYQWQIEASPGVWLDFTTKPTDLPCGGSAAADVDNSANVQIGITPCPGVPEYQVRVVVSNACGSDTSNEATLTVTPVGGVPGNGAGASALLAKPAPNPTHGSTTLGYTLPASSPVLLEIFDAAGRLVKVLVAEEQSAGRHEPVWQGTDASGRAVLSGIYFARLRTFHNGRPVESQRKINLVR
ncbi:MAG TPA: FlgD immunoglobulin-like domain containing protein, partial [Candidatus Eisenbacteria bacterium]